MDLLVAERVLLAAWAGLRDRALPPVLQVGALNRVAIGPEWTRIVTYRSYDALDVPSELLGVLSRFDGRPTERVLDDIRSEAGLELDEELLVKLVDFGVLEGARRGVPD